MGYRFLKKSDTDSSKKTSGIPDVEESMSAVLFGRILEEILGWTSKGFVRIPGYLLKFLRKSWEELLKHGTSPKAITIGTPQYVHGVIQEAKIPEEVRWGIAEGIVGEVPEEIPGVIFEDVPGVIHMEIPDFCS